MDYTTRWDLIDSMDYNGSVNYHTYTPKIYGNKITNNVSGFHYPEVDPPEF